MTATGPVPDLVAPAILEAASAAGIGVAVVEIELGTTPSPRWVYANKALADLAGVSPEELTKRPPFEVLVPEDRDRVRATFLSRMRGEGPAPRHECRIAGPANTSVPVELGVHVFRAADRVFEVLLARDLRDRVAAQASERRFRDLVEAAPDGIVISRRGIVLYANGAGARILGVDAAALVGRALGEFLSPDDAERMRARMAALTSGQVLVPSEYRARRPDGRTVVAEIAAIPVDFEGGPAVLAFARDVTERAAVQAELARTDRLAALGRLAAGMAHEINNPLGFTSLSAEALERRLRLALPDGDERRSLLELVDHVRRGTDRVAAIVRDLKAFSRDSPGTASRVDLGGVLDAAVRMVAHELAPRATLERDVPELPPVIGNAGRLEQVFVNLLVNAAHSFQEGAGGVISMRARVEGESVVVEVGDTGAGIPPEVLERVFDPFFTTKPVGIGTGLGLSICHGIVRSFGGDIDIESRVGRGTTVRVRLSVAPEVAVPRERADAAPVATRRASVLVVEDTPSFATMLAQVLSLQHDVVVMTTVEAAKAALTDGTSRFDVVLCDMTLGDGTGVDVYEHALRVRPDLGPRFVFMTGGAFTPRAIKFLEHTPRPRLEKPFTVTALEIAIQDALR